MTESKHLPESEIDRTLRDLAAHIDYPPTPNLTSIVRHRIQQLPDRRHQQPGAQDVAQPMPDLHLSENEHPSPTRPWLRLLYQQGGMRGHFPREFVQMAAAILVLVLVGGVLAVVFRDQGGTNQGSVGASVTPTAIAGPQLPMAVTANGVAVELQSVDSTITVTRFSFLIELLPDQVPHDLPFPSVLGSNPSEDVTIDGITPGPNDPYVTESDGIGKNPSVGFTLDYQSPFPQEKTVTLTIQHLTLPVPLATTTPIQTTTVQQIDGPWTFSIMPGSVANQPAPTPFSGIGRFGGVSLTKAQTFVSFPITAPNPLPPPLNQTETIKRNTFNVSGYGLAVPESAPANYVMLTYEPPIGGEVFLVETTNDAAVPTINDGSATVLMPLPPTGQTRTLAISPGTVSTSRIGSVTVTRFEVADSTTNVTTIYYVWKQGGVDYSIWHVVDSLPAGQTGVTDTDLHRMVTSIIEQRGAGQPATPQAQSSASALPTPTAFPSASESSQIAVTFPPAAIVFVDGSGVSGNVHAELLADGNLHLVGTADNAGHQLLWMAVSGTCAARDAALSNPVLYSAIVSMARDRKPTRIRSRLTSISLRTEGSRPISLKVLSMAADPSWRVPISTRVKATCPRQLYRT